MPRTQVFTGIDPGLVHTGLVRLVFPPDGFSERWFRVEYHVVDGIDVDAIKEWVDERPGHPVYVEDYRARRSTNNDPEMIKAVDRIQRALPEAVLINNSGSKKTIRSKLLKLLDLWKFPATHHQDLQAAARILVWGMLKDATYNELLAGFVNDHLNGRPWTKHVSADL